MWTKHFIVVGSRSPLSPQSSNVNIFAFRVLKSHLQCMQILYIYSTSMFYIHILSHLLHIPPKYSFLHILTSSFACSSLPCKVIFFVLIIACMFESNGPYYSWAHQDEWIICGQNTFSLCYCFRSFLVLHITHPGLKLCWITFFNRGSVKGFCYSRAVKFYYALLLTYFVFVNNHLQSFFKHGVHVG